MTLVVVIICSLHISKKYFGTVASPSVPGPPGAHVASRAGSGPLLAHLVQPGARCHTPGSPWTFHFRLVVIPWLTPGSPLVNRCPHRYHFTSLPVPPRPI